MGDSLPAINVDQLTHSVNSAIHGNLPHLPPPPPSRLLGCGGFSTPVRMSGLGSCLSVSGLQLPFGRAVQPLQGTGSGLAPILPPASENPCLSPFSCHDSFTVTGPDASTVIADFPNSATATTTTIIITTSIATANTTSTITTANTISTTSSITSTTTAVQQSITAAGTRVSKNASAVSTNTCRGRGFQQSLLHQSAVSVSTVGSVSLSSHLQSLPVCISATSDSATLTSQSGMVSQGGGHVVLHQPGVVLAGSNCRSLVSSVFVAASNSEAPVVSSVPVASSNSQAVVSCVPSTTRPLFIMFSVRRPESEGTASHGSRAELVMTSPAQPGSSLHPLPPPLHPLPLLLPFMPPPPNPQQEARLPSSSLIPHIVSPASSLSVCGSAVPLPVPSSQPLTPPVPLQHSLSSSSSSSSLLQTKPTGGVWSSLPLSAVQLFHPQTVCCVSGDGSSLLHPLFPPSLPTLPPSSLFPMTSSEGQTTSGCLTMSSPAALAHQGGGVPLTRSSCLPLREAPQHGTPLMAVCGGGVTLPTVHMEVTPTSSTVSNSSCLPLPAIQPGVAAVCVSGSGLPLCTIRPRLCQSSEATPRLEPRIRGRMTLNDPPPVSVIAPDADGAEEGGCDGGVKDGSGGGSANGGGSSDVHSSSLRNFGVPTATGSFPFPPSGFPSFASLLSSPSLGLMQRMVILPAPQPAATHLPVPASQPALTYLPAPQPVPIHLPAPASQPAATHHTAPQPAPIHLPVPASQPALTHLHLPAPQPAPIHLSVPQTVLTHLSAPQPAPTYHPAPQPAPTPLPAPKPAPIPLFSSQPAPIPLPALTPPPASLPAPIPPPASLPEPTPPPAPLPASQPAPTPLPASQPAPTPFPALLPAPPPLPALVTLGVNMPTVTAALETCSVSSVSCARVREGGVGNTRALLPPSSQHHSLTRNAGNPQTSGLIDVMDQPHPQTSPLPPFPIHSLAFTPYPPPHPPNVVSEALAISPHNREGGQSEGGREEKGGGGGREQRSSVDEGTSDMSTEEMDMAGKHPPSSQSGHHQREGSLGSSSGDVEMTSPAKEASTDLGQRDKVSHIVSSDDYAGSKESSSEPCCATSCQQESCVSSVHLVSVSIGSSAPRLSHQPLRGISDVSVLGSLPCVMPPVPVSLSSLPLSQLRSVVCGVPHPAVSCPSISHPQMSCPDDTGTRTTAVTSSCASAMTPGSVMAPIVARSLTLASATCHGEMTTSPEDISCIGESDMPASGLCPQSNSSVHPLAKFSGPVSQVSSGGFLTLPDCCQFSVNASVPGLTCAGLVDRPVLYDLDPVPKSHSLHYQQQPPIYSSASHSVNIQPPSANLGDFSGHTSLLQCSQASSLEGPKAPAGCVQPVLKEVSVLTEAAHYGVSPVSLGNSLPNPDQSQPSMGSDQIVRLLSCVPPGQVISGQLAHPAVSPALRGLSSDPLTNMRDASHPVLPTLTSVHSLRSCPFSVLDQLTKSPSVLSSHPCELLGLGTGEAIAEPPSAQWCRCCQLGESGDRTKDSAMETVAHSVEVCQVHALPALSCVPQDPYQFSTERGDVGTGGVSASVPAPRADCQFMDPPSLSFPLPLPSVSASLNQLPFMSCSTPSTSFHLPPASVAPAVSQYQLMAGSSSRVVSHPKLVHDPILVHGHKLVPDPQNSQLTLTNHPHPHHLPSAPVFSLMGTPGTNPQTSILPSAGYSPPGLSHQVVSPQLYSPLTLATLISADHHSLPPPLPPSSSSSCSSSHKRIGVGVGSGIASTETTSVLDMLLLRTDTTSVHTGTGDITTPSAVAAPHASVTALASVPPQASASFSFSTQTYNAESAQTHTQNRTESAHTELVQTHMHSAQMHVELAQMQTDLMPDRVGLTQSGQRTVAIADNSPKGSKHLGGGGVRAGGADGGDGSSLIPLFAGQFCLECSKVGGDEGCMHMLTQHHYHHHHQRVMDRPVLTRARASLPDCLYLAQSNTLGHFNHTGVFAKEALSMRTEFGPLVGRVLPSDDIPQKANFSQWKIFYQGQVRTLDVSEESNSNWLMFLKPARCATERNLLAFQQGHDLLFITTKDIQPDLELRFWFSPDYGRMLLNTPRPPQFCPSCSACSHIFLHRSELRAHAKHTHCTHTAIPTPPPKKLTCLVCDATFPSSWKLREHEVQQHAKEKNHDCPTCGKQFSDARNLKAHHHIHTGLRRFGCDTCGKHFTQKAHLQSHQATHTKVKAAACRFCPKRFMRASDARQHEMTHTHAHVLSCTQCCRTFQRPKLLRRHMRSVHDNQRNYMCERCSKTFHTKYKLMRHAQSCINVKSGSMS